MRKLGKRRRFFLAAMAIATSLSFCVLMAEIALWFFPVSTGIITDAVNERSPIFHATPNRDYVYSKNWNFSIVNQGTVNNVGFINDQNYDANDSSPLLAIIGDSFVEALMVPYRETMHGRLAKAVVDGGRVYSFGFSGAALSQYLAWAQFATRAYNPDGLIFVVVGNDFDQSLTKYDSPRFSPLCNRSERRVVPRTFGLRTRVLSSTGLPIRPVAIPHIQSQGRLHRSRATEHVVGCAASRRR